MPSGRGIVKLRPWGREFCRTYAWWPQTRARIDYLCPFLRGGTPESFRPRVTILGTGWAAVHFLKYLNPLLYDITVVSPRNYFTFTPLLPAVCAGTLSPLSCIEPVRNLMRQRGAITASLYEGVAHHVDFKNNRVECVTEGGDTFHVQYDYLILGIGCHTNTLNIPGVERYAVFLKEVEHAVRFRKIVMNNFERAALPSTSNSEKQRLLHFMAVGGGPTGVEVMAELSDFIQEDLRKYFPQLMSYVRLTLIEAANTVLPTFSPRVSYFTMRSLLRHMRVNLLLQHAVTGIRQKYITIESRIPGQKQRTYNMPYGLCLWACGVANTPLADKITSYVPELQSESSIITDARLRVLGLPNVFALGDCKRVRPPSMKESADEFIKAAGGTIPSTEWFRKNAKILVHTYPQIGLWRFWHNAYFERMDQGRFLQYLEDMDRNYSPPPATAQNAAQEGLYLATVFNNFGGQAKPKLDEAPAFMQRWRGSLAYVGHGRAVATFPGNIDILGGFYSHPMWMLIYLYMQLSFRSRFTVTVDWIRLWLSGRDVGRDHIYIPGETVYIKREEADSKEVRANEEETEDKEVVISPPLTRALNPKLLDMQNV